MQESFDIGSKVEFHERDIDPDSDNEENDDDGLSSYSNLKPTELECKLEELVSNSLPRAYDVVACSVMEAFSDVFLIDHMWTTTFPQMRSQLSELPALVDRIGKSISYCFKYICFEVSLL